jgi:ABC-type uncharacterized transport system involved in gliding motility auxiliary subunit
MTARFTGALSLILLAVLFVAINVLAGLSLRSTRLDLTASKLYTLTEGSKKIASSPPEPITITFYNSQKASRGRPQVENIARRISDLLDEFARASNGKIKIRAIDPEAFSEEEDQAVQNGLVGIPAGGETIYLGIVATNTIGGKETIPLFDINNERFLEYDVARLIQSLSMTKKPVISILSSVNMDGGFAMDPQTGRPMQRRPWGIMRELKSLYDVRTLTGDSIAIPPETSTLLVVHPKKLTPKNQFAIDQWVLAGGRTILFVDPIFEQDEAQPAAQGQSPDRSSNLENLFNAWGVQFSTASIVADADLGIRINAGQQGQRGQQVIFPPWITVDKRGLVATDPATGKVNTVNFATAGFLTKKAAEKPKEGEAAPAPTAADQMVFTPIIQSTTNSQLLNPAALISITDPTTIIANFQPSGNQYAIAARLSGTLTTAFPSGDPAAAETDTTGPNPPPKTDTLKKSAKDASVLIIADVDVLTDRMWTREQMLGGISLGAQKIGDNLDFLTTCLDINAGSGDLLGVRARGDFFRPFTRVEAIQRDAEQKFRAEQDRLKQKLSETEAKIADIQKKDPNATDKDGFIVLTKEQEAEIIKFREEQVETRKQLRNVQFNLRRDVESLGTWVKVINVGAVPIAVMFIALVWGAARALARRASAG